MRPISHTMYDGCHVLMCHGTVHFEMTAFWIAVKAQSLFSFADINDEFQKWSWPKSERNPPYRLFNNVHAKHSDWKGGASECLAMYQLFLWIVCDLLEGTEFFVKELKSLRAMFLVLDGWKAIQGGFVGSHLKFREAVMNHLRLYVEAYGRLACKPKHHMEIMLAVQLHWFGFLLGTSTAERKHKHYKEIAEHIKTPLDNTSFERTCLERLLNQQVTKLSDPSLFARGVFFFDTLQRVPQEVVNNMPTTLTVTTCAHGLSYNGLKFHKSDVVLDQASALAIRIEVILRCDDHGLYIYGPRFDLRGKLYYRVGHRLVKVTEIVGPCIFKSMDHSMHVIAPAIISWQRYLRAA